jgi:hypothetical protein
VYILQVCGLYVNMDGYGCFIVYAILWVTALTLQPVSHVILFHDVLTLSVLNCAQPLLCVFSFVGLLVPGLSKVVLRCLFVMYLMCKTRSVYLIAVLGVVVLCGDVRLLLNKRSRYY